MRKFYLVIMFIGITLSFCLADNKPSYIETDVKLKTSTGDIFGTLMSPENVKSSPLVIIIAGSGPTDRNCNAAMMGLNTNAYKMLAQELAQKGIASLRYDKRGIAMSAGAMKSEAALKFEDYVADAVAWIAMFKADKKFSKIYVLGHSEGSLIGIIAAEQIPVDGLISIAGVGRTADKIILEQIKNQPKEFVDQTKSILDSLVSGKLVKNVSPQMQMLFRPSVQPYMISWLKYDPAKEIKNLLKPVLIVQGTNDIQVSVEDAKLLSAAKPDAKLLIIEKMNHIMKECDADLNKNYETYNKPDLPLKSGLVDGILDFVK